MQDLHYAAFYGDLTSVKRILKCGVTITADLQTSDGPKILKQDRKFSHDMFPTEFHFGFFLKTTPLMMACQQGHLDVAKYLVEHAHADVNARDSLGVTSLGFATSAGRTEVVKYLLSKRALINIQEYHNGMTPLILATKNNQTEMAKLLVKRNANTDLRDKAGRTAIHYAAWNYNHELVNFLARQNDIKRIINIQDYHGNTPLHLLVTDDDFETLPTDDFSSVREQKQMRQILNLIAKDRNTYVNMHRAFSRGTGKVGELCNCFVKMIRMGAYVSARNNAGHSVLHVLCGRLPPAIYSHGYLYVDDPVQTQNLLVVLKMLLKCGALWNAPDLEGHTPMSLSSSQRNWLAVKILSENADANAVCDVTDNAFGNLGQMIEAYGWNHVIEPEELQNDVELISSALLARQKVKGAEKLAEMLFDIQML